MKDLQRTYSSLCFQRRPQPTTSHKASANPRTIQWALVGLQPSKKSLLFFLLILLLLTFYILLLTIGILLLYKNQTFSFLLKKTRVNGYFKNVFLTYIYNDSQAKFTQIGSEMAILMKITQKN